MNEGSLERLCKWRTLFAGWQLGTRAKGDPEGDAVRDHREATIILRAELTAVVGLLIEKKVFSGKEFIDALHAEAEKLNADYEHRFPGVRATDIGLEMDVAKVQGWMKDWKP